MSYNNNDNQQQQQQQQNDRKNDDTNVVFYDDDNFYHNSTTTSTTTRSKSSQFEPLVDDNSECNYYIGNDNDNKDNNNNDDEIILYLDDNNDNNDDPNTNETKSDDIRTTNNDSIPTNRTQSSIFKNSDTSSACYETSDTNDNCNNDSTSNTSTSKIGINSIFDQYLQQIQYRWNAEDKEEAEHNENNSINSNNYCRDNRLYHQNDNDNDDDNDEQGQIESYLQNEYYREDIQQLVQLLLLQDNGCTPTKNNTTTTSSTDPSTMMMDVPKYQHQLLSNTVLLSDRTTDTTITRSNSTTTDDTSTDHPNSNDDIDTELHYRYKDYRIARFLRQRRCITTNNNNNNNSDAEDRNTKRTNTNPPYGIYGMIQYLQTIQMDMGWVMDSSYRRFYRLPYFAYYDYRTCMETVLTPTFPIFTATVIGMCTIALIVSFVMNDWVMESLHVNPMIGPSAHLLLQMGAINSIPIIDNGEYYRFVTALILHAGMIHYCINMISIVFIFPDVERMYGTIPITIVFLLGGTGGNILSCLFNTQYQISIGASGGILCIVGICLADISTNWKLITIPMLSYKTKYPRPSVEPQQQLLSTINQTGRVRLSLSSSSLSSNVSPTDKSSRSSFPAIKVIISLVLEIGCVILLGFTPYVDQFVHLGGLLYGIGFGYFVIPNHVQFFTKQRKGQFHRYIGRLPLWRIIPVGCAIAMYLVSIWMLMQAVHRNDIVDTGVSNNAAAPCKNCKFISCIPFPFWKSPNDRWWNCNACDYLSVQQSDIVLVHSSGGNKHHPTNDTSGMDHPDTTVKAIFPCPDGTIQHFYLSEDQSSSSTTSIWEDNHPIATVRDYCRQLCPNI